MRTFSDIEIGDTLSFVFEGRRFLFPAQGSALLSGTGFCLDISQYDTAMWRQRFDITDEEWSAFRQQFNDAIDDQTNLIVERMRQRAERDRQHAEEERLRAIELEKRKQENRHILKTGEYAELMVIERPGECFLQVVMDWSGTPRLPITKALHDMLITELGVNEERTKTDAWESWERNWEERDDEN